MEKTKEKKLEKLLEENKLLKHKLLRIKKLIESWKGEKNKESS